MGRVTMMNETHDAMRGEAAGGEWRGRMNSTLWVIAMSREDFKREEKKRPKFQGKHKMSKRPEDAYAHFKQHLHLGWR